MQHVKNCILYLNVHFKTKYIIKLPFISLDSDSLSVCSNNQSKPNVSGDSNEDFVSISRKIKH